MPDEEVAILFLRNYEKAKIQGRSFEATGATNNYPPLWNWMRRTQGMLIALNWSEYVIEITPVIPGRATVGGCPFERSEYVRFEMIQLVQAVYALAF